MSIIHLGYVPEEGVHPTRLSIFMIGPAPNYYFVKIQELPYTNVRALTHTVIQTTTYLVIGNYYQDLAGKRFYSSPSQVLLMRYDTPTNIFHFHSSLPGSGVYDIECFTTQGKSYMVVANYREDSGNLDIFSYVFIYNSMILYYTLDNNNHHNSLYTFLSCLSITYACLYFSFW